MKVEVHTASVCPVLHRNLIFTSHLLLSGERSQLTLFSGHDNDLCLINKSVTFWGVGGEGCLLRVK